MGGRDPPPQVYRKIFPVSTLLSQPNKPMAAAGPEQGRASAAAVSQSTMFSQTNTLKAAASPDKGRVSASVVPQGSKEEGEEEEVEMAQEGEEGRQGEVGGNEEGEGLRWAGVGGLGGVGGARRGGEEVGWERQGVAGEGGQGEDSRRADEGEREGKVGERRGGEGGGGGGRMLRMWARRLEGYAGDYGRLSDCAWAEVCVLGLSLLVSGSEWQGKAWGHGQEGWASIRGERIGEDREGRFWWRGRGDLRLFTRGEDDLQVRGGYMGGVGEKRKGIEVPLATYWTASLQTKYAPLPKLF